MQNLTTLGPDTNFALKTIVKYIYLFIWNLIYDSKSKTIIYT